MTELKTGSLILKEKGMNIRYIVHFHSFFSFPVVSHSLYLQSSHWRLKEARDSFPGSSACGFVKVKPFFGSQLSFQIPM